MCRNIRTLFNFEPPATESEIRDASLQFVRKLSGFTRPSQANQPAFDLAVVEVAAAADKLMASLVTNALPKNRVAEAATRAKFRTCRSRRRAPSGRPSAARSALATGQPCLGRSSPARADDRATRRRSVARIRRPALRPFR